MSLVNSIFTWNLSLTSLSSKKCNIRAFIVMELKNLVLSNSKSYFITHFIIYPTSMVLYFYHFHLNVLSLLLFYSFSFLPSLSFSMKHEQTHILCQPLPTTTTATRKLKTTTTNATHNSQKSKPRPKLNHKPTTPISQPSIQPCHNYPLPQP